MSNQKIKQCVQLIDEIDYMFLHEITLFSYLNHENKLVTVVGNMIVHNPSCCVENVTYLIYS